MPLGGLGLRFSVLLGLRVLAIQLWDAREPKPQTLDPVYVFYDPQHIHSPKARKETPPSVGLGFRGLNPESQARV